MCRDIKLFDAECDAVIHLRNGRYGLVEIKLGGEALINEAVASLNKLENRIDTDKLGRASFPSAASSCEKKLRV